MALYLPKGSIMLWNDNSITEHNRTPVSVSPIRIENSKRMANGTLRKYFVADKRKWTTSWDAVPSETEKTVDGKWGGDAMETFYNATPGAFYLKIMEKPFDVTVTATIVASTGVFTTSVAHTLIVGDTVVLGAITATTGVTAGTAYYVRTVPATNTFTLSASRGGGALTLATNGSTASVNQMYLVMFTEFTKSIVKRGNYHAWDVSVSMEEV